MANANQDAFLQFCLSKLDKATDTDSNITPWDIWKDAKASVNLNFILRPFEVVKPKATCSIYSFKKPPKTLSKWTWYRQWINIVSEKNNFI